VAESKRNSRSHNALPGTNRQMPFAADDIELRVTVARLESTHVVTLTGELDLHSAAALRDAVSPIVSEGRGDLIVDLTGIAFIDSTALGILVGAAKQLRRRKAELIVATDDPRLRRLLEITGLLGTLAYEPTLAEAVVHVGGNSPA
jgi:anti-sigma B factor antagonist